MNRYTPKVNEPISMTEEMNKVFKYMGKSKFMVFIALVMAAIGAIMIILGPSQVGKITEYISNGLMGNMDMHSIATIGCVLVSIYLIGSIVTFIEHFIMATVTLKTSKDMRSAISKKINKVPQAYFNKTSQGDILSRVTNDVSNLQQGLSNSLPVIVSALAQFVGCLIMMFVTEWRLALTTIAVTILGLFIVVLITKHSQKYFIAKQESLGKLNGYVEEMYSGQAIVKTTKAQDKIQERFIKLNDKVYESNWKSQFYSGMMQPLMTTIGNIGYVVVAVFGSFLAYQGIINFGVIVSFILYVRLFTSPLGQIAQGLTSLQTTSASAHRIFEFLNEEELSDESNKNTQLDTIKGAVKFDHVKFSYPSNPDKLIIKDLSINVIPGEKVAIVGPTGAGKTTMVNLLMRFFEINDGTISIDGIDTSKLKRSQIHDIFSMVLQDTWLFEGTLRENLVYNLKDISDQDILKACKACGLEHFVKTLPKGLDTVLTDISSISAGQRQLITIARAMIKNSPMLILDEATSSVDTRTELKIQQAMDKLTKGRTSFVIAHRLSTIKNADLILVMKDGDVIESGNHNQLLKKKGFYAELYNSQFQNN